MVLAFLLFHFVYTLEKFALLFERFRGSWMESASSSCSMKLLFASELNRLFQMTFNIRPYIANISSRESASSLSCILLIISSLVTAGNVLGHVTMPENPRVDSLKLDIYV